MRSRANGVGSVVSLSASNSSYSFSPGLKPVNSMAISSGACPAMRIRSPTRNSITAGIR